MRELGNPLATRFELRAPNPKSNTYLVIAASYMAMLDGIKASLEAKKSSDDLLASLSKKWGDEDFYHLKRTENTGASERYLRNLLRKREISSLAELLLLMWENINAFVFTQKARSI